MSIFHAVMSGVWSVIFIAGVILDNVTWEFLIIALIHSVLSEVTNRRK